MSGGRYVTSFTDVTELRHAARAFEHQMFEEVRHAGMAARFVGGANAIPELMRHDWRAPLLGSH